VRLTKNSNSPVLPDDQPLPDLTDVNDLGGYKDEKDESLSEYVPEVEESVNGEYEATTTRTKQRMQWQ
jgi:hypothetical protein